MNKKDIKLQVSFKPVIRFFSKFHTIIFFLIVSIGMAAAILTLIVIIQLSSTSAPSANNTVNENFDQVTIDKINQLGTQPPTPPPGQRISPFVE